MLLELDFFLSMASPPQASQVQVIPMPTLALPDSSSGSSVRLLSHGESIPLLLVFFWRLWNRLRILSSIQLPQFIEAPLTLRLRFKN